MTDFQASMRQRRTYDIEALDTGEGSQKPQDSQDSQVIKLQEEICKILLELDISIQRTLKLSKAELSSVSQLITDHLYILYEDKSNHRKVRVNRYVKGLSHEKQSELVLDRGITRQYYSRMIDRQISTYKNVENMKLDEDDESLRDWSLASIEDDLSYTIKEWLKLREKVEEVAEKDILEPKITSCLTELIKIMDREIKIIYQICENATRLPILPDISKSMPSGPKPSVDTPIKVDSPTKIAKQSKTLSVLAFLIPIICALSSIPSLFAWVHTDAKPGKTTDSDFFQLISSVPIQLLGIGTTLWPIIKDLRPDRAAWVQGWTLAIISASFTIAAVPLYILVPTSWSAMSLFGGSCVQLFLQLQLLLRISMHESHVD